MELVHQTWTLFSASSFDHNFQPNANQTFIVYAKSALVLYRKGLCGFFQFWDSPWKKSYVEKSVVSIMDQREYKTTIKNNVFKKQNLPKKTLAITFLEFYSAHILCISLFHCQLYQKNQYE